MCAWFETRGLVVDEEELFGDFMGAPAVGSRLARPRQ